MNGTYTQRRRRQMAYGGIAGLDGRMQYGIGSFFQKAKDKIVGGAKKVVDIVKDNPMAATILGGGLLNQYGLPSMITDKVPFLGEDAGKNWIGNILGGIPGVPDNLNLVIGDDRNLLGQYTGAFPDQIGDWTPGAGNISDYVLSG